MDPVITTIVSAVALGAASGLKPVVEQTMKDAYAGLKRVITDRYQDRRKLIEAVQKLEQKPEDKDSQAALEKELGEAKADKDTKLIAAANAVHTATLAETSRQRILEKRIQRLLQQAEALENQYDLSLDEGQKVVLKEKAQQIWSQIAELEKQFGAGG